MVQIINSQFSVVSKPQYIQITSILIKKQSSTSLFCFLFLSSLSKAAFSIQNPGRMSIRSHREQHSFSDSKTRKK